MSYLIRLFILLFVSVLVMGLVGILFGVLYEYGFDYKQYSLHTIFGLIQAFIMCAVYQGWVAKESSAMRK